MDNQSTPQVKTKRWPNLSMYGLRLVSVKIPTGEWRLVMMGGDKFPSQVSKLGFRQQGGIWLKGNANITMDELRASFKRVTVYDALPETDIYRIMRPKNATANTAEEIAANLAIKTATPIGINHLGQEVFIGPDGRFIRSGDGKVVTMTERGMTPAMFLRAENHEDLEKCADALVLQIMDGVVYRDEDIELFASRIFDKPFADCAPDIQSLHDAINHALSRAMIKGSPDAGRNAFNLAIKLHEGLPPLTEDLAEKIVTLPVGVVIQRLAGVSQEQTLYVPTIGNGAMLSAVPDDMRILTNEVYDTSRDVLKSSFDVSEIDTDGGKTPPAHDISLVNFGFKESAEPINILGTKLNREDHASVMAMLNQRSADGKSVLLLKAGGKPGEVDSETKRLLTWISARNHVESIVELDGSLFGTGGSANNRYMVVVGQAGQSPLVNFDRVSVMYDYESLWSWADHFVSEKQRLSELPALTENSYQAPYMPASRIGKASTMIPRNLLGPVRLALAKTEEEFGQMDEFVSNSIQMPFSEMAECFSPEQIDAIGLAIAAHKHGKGFINADQTGMGKGRALVGVARYAALSGLNVIFMSEKLNLFGDFYRDILDTHSERILIPFVLNQNAPVIVDGVKHIAATPKEVVAHALETHTIPAGTNLVMTTYSQFNRDNRKNTDPKSQFIKSVGENAFLVLDEAHNAAGDSNTGFNILRTMRNISGVVYSSATYAKDATNFRIYSKVMPPSVSPNSIPGILRKGGDPLAEVFSAMLAEDAVMIRREHDLSKMRFETVVDDVYAERNEELADKFAEILEGMGVLMGEVGSVLNDKNSLIQQDFIKKQDIARQRHIATGSTAKFKPQKFNIRDRGWFGGNFGSSLYATMRQFFLAIKTDFSADMAIKALEEGRKPVITLETTNETLLRTAIEKQEDLLNEGAIEGEYSASTDDAEDVGEDAVPGDALDEAFEEMMREAMQLTSQDEGFEEGLDDGDEVLTVPVTFRDILYRMLDRMSVVNQVVKGKITKQERIETEEINRFRQAVEMKIDAFPDLYISPIDVIRQKIEDAGYTCTEISGRTMGVVTRPDGKQVIKRIRQGNRNKTIDGFNNGTTDAIVLTVAGSTGISLHAGEKFKDQRQRELIEAQIANNVATRLQILGRVGRKGQVCWPIIRTVDSGLPSETRLISMQSAKLREMSANTTSNRDSSIADNDMLDLLNPVGSEICRQFLLNNLQIATRLLIDHGDLVDAVAQTKDKLWYANQLTGRLGMLYVKEQNEIYNSIADAYREEIDALTQAGKNPFKANELDVNAKVSEQIEIFSPVIKTGSVFDTPVFQTTITYDKKVDTYTERDIKDLIKEHNDNYFKDITPSEYLNHTIERLENKLPALLDKSWSPRMYDSLEHALADEDSASSALKKRVGLIKKWAPSLLPYNVVTFTDNEGNVHNGLILKLLPIQQSQSDYLGKYEINIYVPGEGRTWRSLYSLVKDPAFNISSDNAQMMEDVRNKSFVSVRTQSTVLEGNIFAACEWSTDKGVGVSSIYTNEHGERCRGVILPRDYDFANKISMEKPFTVDVDVAKEVVMQMARGFISFRDEGGRKNNFIDFSTTIKKAEPGIEILLHEDTAIGSITAKLAIPKAREGIQFIDASNVPSVREQQFKLEKGKREGHKIFEVSIDDLPQIIEDIYESNMSLFIPMARKDAVLEIYDELQLAKNGNKRLKVS